MAYAFIYPTGQQGRGKKDSETKPFSTARLSQARTILRESRPLAVAVLKGSLPFDEALAQIEEAKQQATSAEAKLARLQVAC
jgi:hypothetical protein